MRKSFQYMTSSCSMNFTWVIKVNIDTIYWYDLLGWLVSKIHLKFHYSIMIVITHKPTKRQFAGGDWHFPMHFNSLAPGKFAWNFRQVIFKQILVIDDWGISCEIALIWMSLDFTDDQSTLVQVMAWCRQATSHYLSQCWPRSLSLHGITRPQWVNESYPLTLK